MGFDRLRYDALLSQSSVENESALIRRGEHIERCWEAFLGKTGDADEYDILWRKKRGRREWQ